MSISTLSANLCEGCRYDPPSSFGNKPCSFCVPFDPLCSCYERREIKEETEDDE